MHISSANEDKRYRWLTWAPSRTSTSLTSCYLKKVIPPAPSISKIVLVLHVCPSMRMLISRNLEGLLHAIPKQTEAPLKVSLFFFLTVAITISFCFLLIDLQNIFEDSQTIRNVSLYNYAS